MKDTGQLRGGRERAERGLATGAKTERKRAYIAAVGQLYSNFERTPQRSRLLAYRDAMGQLATREETGRNRTLVRRARMPAAPTSAEELLAYP